jgi:hypothetical protein
MLLVRKNQTTTRNHDVIYPDDGKPIDDAATVVEEDNLSEHGDVISEMAQYQPGELLDSVSVASEWTMSTDVESKVSPSKRKTGTAHDVYSETFGDRQVALQKDMLHSEWTSAPPTNTQKARISQVLKSPEPGMSFAKAHGGQEGEEVYLMPPTRAKRRGEQ